MPEQQRKFGSGGLISSAFWVPYTDRPLGYETDHGAVIEGIPCDRVSLSVVICMQAVFMLTACISIGCIFVAVLAAKSYIALCRTSVRPSARAHAQRLGLATVSRVMRCSVAGRQGQAAQPSLLDPGVRCTELRDRR